MPVPLWLFADPNSIWIVEEIFFEIFPFFSFSFFDVVAAPAL